MAAKSGQDSRAALLSGQSILISGQDVPVEHSEIDQASLRYYELNPRVFSMVRQDGKSPTQDEIQNALLGMEHVKELAIDITRNGGLIEPLIVKKDTREVLEGNSRLAAYRHLFAKDPVKWGKVRCVVLPASVTESQIFALLGQLHVKGKKDWARFEQAGFLYRRYTQQKVDIPTLALEINLPQKTVEHLIKTYKFMSEHEESDISHWSHYDEYLKSRKIAKARAKYPTFDETIVGLIKNDRSFKAVDVRDKLPTICAGPPKTLKRFAGGEVAFDDAFDIAEDSGVGNKPYLKIHKFRQWLANADVAKMIGSTTGQERERIDFELKKIKSRTIALLGMRSKK